MAQRRFVQVDFRLLGLQLTDSERTTLFALLTHLSYETNQITEAIKSMSQRIGQTEATFHKNLKAFVTKGVIRKEKQGNRVVIDLNPKYALFGSTYSGTKFAKEDYLK